MERETERLVSVARAVEEIAPYSRGKSNSQEKYVYELIDKDKLIDVRKGEVLPATEPRITRKSLTEYIDARVKRAARRGDSAFPKNEATTSPGEGHDHDAKSASIDERLSKIEEQLQLLLNARQDAADILKAQVEEQRKSVEDALEEARKSRHQRDAAVQRLMEAWGRNDDLQATHAAQSSTLRAFADALTQLLAPPLPPEF